MGHVGHGSQKCDLLSALGCSLCACIRVGSRHAVAHIWALLANTAYMNWQEAFQYFMYCYSQIFGMVILLKSAARQIKTAFSAYLRTLIG